MSYRIRSIPTAQPNVQRLIKVYLLRVFLRRSCKSGSRDQAQPCPRRGCEDMYVVQQDYSEYL